MSRSSHSDSLLLAGPTDLERIVDQFEVAWQLGSPPPIKLFLDSAQQESSRQAVLEELIKVDLEYRWRRHGGKTTSVEGTIPARPIMEDYARAFPDLGSQPGLQLRLIAEEYRVRRKWGDDPSPLEYVTRFPRHTPELADLLQQIAREVVPDPTWMSDTPHLKNRAAREENGIMFPLPARSMGDYEILEELGRGGMGVVYKARQHSLNRIVALKMILAANHAGTDERARFRREAESAAQLQHPHIVQIYEIGEQDGRPFFSLEYIEGGNLTTRLAGQPQVPKEAAALVESLAHAMQYAHDRGVIHRDLKPANILLQSVATGQNSVSGKTQIPLASDEGLLTAGYTPKITDFGLAKRLDAGHAATQTGSILGTPSYMAPEQAQGESTAVGPAVDVYALGAILYELLTGRPPFRGATILETLEQVRSQDPVPPRQLQPRLPRDLETICLKCLQNDRRRRYVHANELADDLRRFQDGKPIRARPVTSLERLWKWTRRRPAVAALLMLILVSGIAAAASGWVYTAKLHEAHEQEKRQAILTEQAHGRAESQRQLAEENLTKAMQSLEHIGKTVFERGRGGPELEEFKTKILTDMTIHFQTFLGTADHPNPEIRRWTGRAYKGLGMSYSLLGRHKDAETAHRSAVRIYERLVEEAPDSNIYRHDLAAANCMLGDEYGAQGQLENAESAYRGAIRLFHTLTDVEDFGDKGWYNLAVTSHNFARRLSLQHQPQKALEWHDAAIDIMTDLRRRMPDNEEARATLLSAHAMRAYSLDQLARHSDALKDWQRALELDQ